MLLVEGLDLMNEVGQLVGWNDLSIERLFGDRLAFGFLDFRRLLDHCHSLFVDRVWSEGNFLLCGTFRDEVVLALQKVALGAFIPTGPFTWNLDSVFGHQRIELVIGHIVDLDVNFDGSGDFGSGDDGLFGFGDNGQRRRGFALTGLLQFCTDGGFVAPGDKRQTGGYGFCYFGGCHD